MYTCSSHVVVLIFYGNQFQPAYFQPKLKERECAKCKWAVLSAPGSFLETDVKYVEALTLLKYIDAGIKYARTQVISSFVSGNFHSI